MLRVFPVAVVCVAFACTPRSRTTQKESEPDTPVEQPEVAEEAPVEEPTKGSNIATEEVEYAGGEATLKGFIAYDSTIDTPRPGVLVVHEWWGHNEYTRDRAKQLAEMGYTAFAIDMYGDGKQASHPDDAKKFMTEVMSNQEIAVARFTAAKKLLDEHPTTDPEKTAAIGYCFGGAVVLHMARTGMDLEMVGAFHAGSLNSGITAKKGDIAGKVFVAHGEADPFVEPAAIEAFKKEMDAAEVDYTFISYPGAKHAFTNPAATANGEKFGLPLAYNKEADEKSWSEFEQQLKSAMN